VQRLADSSIFDLRLLNADCFAAENAETEESFLDAVFLATGDIHFLIYKQGSRIKQKELCC
jgi:hypothetical protein